MKTKVSMETLLKRLMLTGAITLIAAAHSNAQNLLIDTWFTADSGKYARIYSSKEAALTNGTVSTWTGQTLPAYSDIQQVESSANWVYVRTTGLPSHLIGPWYFDAAKNNPFTNLPKNQKVLNRFPRIPTVAATKTWNYLGSLGLWVNGVGFFNMLDGAFYNNGAESQDMGAGVQTAYWIRNAMAVEVVTFDNSNGHQPPTGIYHYHASPNALRHQLGDNITFTRVGGLDNAGVYTENTNNLRHSPILGWSYDGYPVYGAYGYDNPSTNSTDTTIRRIKSGFVPRNGNFGTDNLAIGGRNALPKWAANMRGLTTTSNTYAITDTTKRGPAVTSTYVIGYWVEDFAYLGDLGYTQGPDFDLDIYNGRFCRTPEYPQGTYAYFTTLDANGQPAFPYAIGRQWYGNVTGGAVTTIAEAVTTNFVGGTKMPLALSAPEVEGNTVTLTWSAVEGGTYRVESTTNFATWTTNSTNLTATSNTGRYTNSGAGNIGFYKATRTAVAPFDPVSGTTTGGGRAITSISPTSGARGTTFTLTIILPNTAPPANAPINSVTVGTITGTGNVHVSQTQVTSTITIPAGAATGPQTVTVVFPGAPPNPTVTESYTLANGFTILP
jgi:YHYH protein